MHFGDLGGELCSLHSKSGAERDGAGAVEGVHMASCPSPRHIRPLAGIRRVSRQRGTFILAHTPELPLYELLSFRIATDALTADWSTVLVVPTGIQVGSVIVKPANIDEAHAAVLELLVQPAGDGIDDTQKTIPGGLANGSDLVIAYVRSTDTVQFGANPPWSRAKSGTGLCGGLVAFGIVAA